MMLKSTSARWFELPTPADAGTTKVTFAPLKYFPPDAAWVFQSPLQIYPNPEPVTILDTKGADTLIGRGDMLFSPPGTSRLVRAQGAFVSDEEVQEMVEFLKRNGIDASAVNLQNLQVSDSNTNQYQREGAGPRAPSW